MYVYTQYIFLYGQKEGYEFWYAVISSLWGPVALTFPLKIAYAFTYIMYIFLLSRLYFCSPMIGHHLVILDPVGYTGNTSWHMYVYHISDVHYTEFKLYQDSQ